MCILRFGLIVVVAAGGAGWGEVVKGNIIDVIVNEKESFFYLDKKDLCTVDRDLAIGMFDSGTGGLTVLDAIVNLDKYDNKRHEFKAGGDGVKDFEKEYFVYLGDKANMPYGNYAKEGKTELLQEHIIKDVWFLLGRKYYLDVKDEYAQMDKPGVKVIVIACNTATAFGKDYSEEFIERLGVNVKVIGVIDAGVKAAVKCLGTEESGSIAVLATAGTVSSEGYVKSLEKQKLAGTFSGEIEIFQQAGIGIAGAIDGVGDYINSTAKQWRKDYKGPSAFNENVRIDISILDRYGFEGGGNSLVLKKTVDEIIDVQLNSVSNYISYHVVTLMEKIRKAGTGKLKVLILGCTHYPFYENFFRTKLKELYNYREGDKYLYRPFMAEEVELIDPAGQVAVELYEYLLETELFNNSSMYKSQFYLSVPNFLNEDIELDDKGVFTYEYKYGRDAGQIQEYVKHVPFHKAGIMDEIKGRVSEGMPVVYEMIKAHIKDVN